MSALATDSDWQRQARADPGIRTYQLHITLDAPQTIQVGRLGRYHFPAGRYVYTGSARRNLLARVLRHLSDVKRPRWHIDYLLLNSVSRVSAIVVSRQPECVVNQATAGSIPVNGFGASDCHAGCGSHLKYLGETDENPLS